MKNRYLFWLCISFVGAAFISAVCTRTVEFIISLSFFVSFAAYVLCKTDAKVAATLIVIGASFSLIW